MVAFEDINIVDIIDGPSAIILLRYSHNDQFYQENADDVAYVLGNWFFPLLQQWYFINPTPRRLFLIHLALHDAALYHPEFYCN